MMEVEDGGGVVDMTKLLSLEYTHMCMKIADAACIQVIDHHVMGCQTNGCCVFTLVSSVISSVKFSSSKEILTHGGEIDKES